MKLKRETKETKIALDLELLGSGDLEVDTGLKFFDHMVHLMLFHAGFSGKVIAKGDIEVDCHHTVEDVAIAIGTLIHEILGDKKGTNRYGFLLPMDESLATIAIDLCNRSTLVWKATFAREMIGDVATENFKHFFLSFADALKCSLHITVEGENEHHKIEAIFKGVGRALREAFKEDILAKGQVPSTKGSV